MSVQDEIRREMNFPVARERVWTAITDPARLEQWFGTRAEFKRLVAGEPIIFGWDEQLCRGVIAEVEPPSRFAYRWHSQTSDMETPFDEIPSTLVTFTLDEVPDGTRLTLVESGFASLPPTIRNAAFRENASGWDAELNDLQGYLETV